MPEHAEALARSIWSGSISFGLVSIPVELYTATRRAAPALRMLTADGTPLTRQYVCPQDGQVLGSDDLERGYEVSDGKFVIVTDEELEKLSPRRSRDISLERFVERSSIDPAYFVRAYYLVPGAEQTKAYRLLADTMEATGRAALASFVMRGHAYAVAIFADHGILRAQILRFGDELRSAQDLDLPKAGKIDRGRVAQLEKQIEKLTQKKIDESELEDDQARELIALAQKKRERGEDVVEAAEAQPEEVADAGGDVLDLMALLKERLAERRPAHRRTQAGNGKRDEQTKPSRTKRKAGKSDGLDSASKQELYEKARKAGISGRSKMSREELLASLRHAG